MFRTGFVLATGILALALLPAPAAAASFDCARAHNADEIAVCRDPNLSALDSEMGGLWYAYSRVPMLMGGNGTRMDEAQAFLARRGACGSDVPCLTAAYRARIAELHDGIDWAMENYAQFVLG